MNENDFQAMKCWDNPQFPPEEQFPPQWPDLSACLLPFQKAVEQLVSAAQLALVPIKQVADQLGVELPPRPREDGRPHPPRPSTTPPMWAQNPGRTRRNRNKSTDARTPFV
ncbi:hypothetical protein [Cellulomonas sp. NPDC058312]|uniref:hypothetical protein n=1 Tax=Cellulomonas sp. NPDC058312 TaxID=3346441 RepID=UPI0036F074C5